MSDFVEKFGFDVVGAQDLANKLNKALREYGQIADNINKVNAKFNSQGKANRVVVSGLDEDFKKFTITLKANGGVWKTLGTDVTKTVKSLTAVEERIQAIINLEQRAAKLRAFNQTLKNKAGQASADSIGLNESLGIARRERIQRMANELGQISANRIRTSERLAAYTRKVAQEQANLQNQFTRTGYAGKQAGQEVLISWLSVQRLFVVQVLHQAIAQFRLAMENATRTALEYSKRISEIRTLSQEAGESYQVWNKALIDQSNAFGLDLLDVTKATYEALSNQIIDTTKDMQFLTDATKLALITNSDLTTSVNALSSVINSFGFSQAETSRIAAVLFKTIDLGKTTLPELANNLGRVNSLSKALGVSFEEQQAALSTLTIQGIEDHTAKTFLVNIYQKLLHPTKEMSKIFEEWGVSSGGAAIKTYSLAEVLQRLFVLAEKSGDAAAFLGGIFQEIRATTGYLTLDLDIFGKHLKENLQAGADFVNGFKQVFESDGRQIQIQITKLKNAFIEYGGAIGKAFLNLTKMLGDSDKIMKSVLHTVINLVETYALYKGIMFLVNSGTKVYTATVYTLHAAMLALRGSTFAASTLFGNFWPALIAAGAYAFVNLVNYARNWRERIEEDVIKVREQFDKLHDESMQRGIDLTNQWGDNFIKKSSSIFKRLGELNIAFTQQVNTLSVNLKKMNESFVESVKNIFKDEKETFKANIERLKQTIKDAQSDIDLYQKDVKNPHQLLDEQLGLMLDESKNDIQEKIELLNRGLRDSMSQIKIGQNFDSIREGYSRALDYAKQLHAIYTEQNNQGGMNQAQQLYMKLLHAQNEALQRQINLRQELIDKSKKELEDQQKRQKNFEDNFENFKGLKKDANIQDFDKMAAKLNEAAKASNLGISEQLQLFNLIQQHRKNFEQNNIAAQAEKTLATLRAQADAVSKVVNKNVEEHKASAAKLQQSLTDGQKKYLDNLTRLRGLYATSFSSEDSPQDRANQITNLKKIDELKNATNRLDNLKGSGNFQEISKVITDIINKTNELSTAIDYRFQREGDQTVHGMLSSFQDLNEQLKIYNEQAVSLDQANVQFEILKNNLTSLNSIQPSVVDGFRQGVEQVKSMAEQIKELNQQVLQYRNMTNTVGLPQSKYSGGRIGHYYAGGGTDTQLAYLTPGEYVWDRETTKNMYPLIKGLHQMNKYQGNSGGSVSNNYTFGNINVSSNSGDGSAVAQEVMRTIKREIRRGTFAI